jgi:hypothetical protein
MDGFDVHVAGYCMWKWHEQRQYLEMRLLEMRWSMPRSAVRTQFAMPKNFKEGWLHKQFRLQDALAG